MIWKFLLNSTKNPLLDYWRKSNEHLERLISNGANILFPPRCLSCGSYISTNLSAEMSAKLNMGTTKTLTKANQLNWSCLCSDCFESIPINSGFSCPICTNRLPELKNFCHPEAKYILAAASSYQNAAVRETIHAFKYRSVKKAVAPLSKILNLYLEKIISHLSLIANNSIIIPIPLHRRRERRRGYNQSLLLAEELALFFTKKHLDAQHQHLNFQPKNIVRNDILIKIKITQPQAELNDKADRRKNVQNSFAITDELAAKGKNIILVDDVFTSGATLDEAATVLKSAGAKKIIAFVIAQA